MLGEAFKIQKPVNETDIHLASKLTSCIRVVDEWTSVTRRIHTWPIQFPFDRKRGFYISHHRMESHPPFPSATRVERKSSGDHWKTVWPPERETMLRSLYSKAEMMKPFEWYPSEIDIYLDGICSRR